MTDALTNFQPLGLNMPFGVSLPVSPEQAFRNTLANPSVPKIYGNTFSVVLGSGDLAVMYGAHGIPSGVVFLSWPAAKTLAMKIAEAVKQYEEQAKVEVIDLEQLEKSLLNKTAP
jgi:hypothetical protein